MKPTGDAGGWCREWFGSAYYPLLYRNRDEAEAQRFIGALMLRLGLPQGALILDLACGRGRHALQLHRLGYSVTGIDNSEESIGAAQAHSTDGLDFFVHDMRQLFWDAHFDAVLNLFTSFGYFHSKEDDLRVIRSVHDALRPGGHFVIDYLNVDVALQRMVAEETLESEGVRFTVNRSVSDGMIVKDIAVNDAGREMRFREEVDLLRLEHFMEYFGEAGLHVEDILGDYGLGPFHPAQSDRLIIIAKKKEK